MYFHGALRKNSNFTETARKKEEDGFGALWGRDSAKENRTSRAAPIFDVDFHQSEGVGVHRTELQR